MKLIGALHYFFPFAIFLKGFQVFPDFFAKIIVQSEICFLYLLEANFSVIFAIEGGLSIP